MPLLHSNLLKLCNGYQVLWPQGLESVSRPVQWRIDSLLNACRIVINVDLMAIIVDSYLFIMSSNVFQLYGYTVIADLFTLDEMKYVINHCFVVSCGFTLFTVDTVWKWELVIFLGCCGLLSVSKVMKFWVCLDKWIIVLSMYNT